MYAYGNDVTTTIGVTAMAKTRTMGTIPTKDLKKLTSYPAYHTASKAFAEAKTIAQAAKETLRNEIMKALKLEGDIDFSITPQGAVVTENLEPKAATRRRGTVLSIS
jgi:hypothetical protein